MKKLTLLVSVCTITLSAMACTTEQRDLGQPPNKNDSIVEAALGDSIFNIIKNAKSISAEIIGYTDTTKEKTPKVNLSKEDLNIMKFLMLNPQNTASNDTVFGKFLPNINFIFQYKKQICQLFFDFGLKKWQVRDANGNVLKNFDLGSPEVVHLSSRLFPDDDYLSELLKP
jgi:hypothetical protein